MKSTTCLCCKIFIIIGTKILLFFFVSLFYSLHINCLKHTFRESLVIMQEWYSESLCRGSEVIGVVVDTFSLTKMYSHVYIIYNYAQNVFKI